VPNCLHMIFFVLFYCGRREYLTSLQVCYSHQGIGIVKWYWDCHLLCNNKNTPVTNRTVTYRFCLQRLDFNVVSSTGWRCNKLQMEFIWIDLEKIDWLIDWLIYSCSCDLQQAPLWAIRYRTSQNYLGII